MNLEEAQRRDTALRAYMEARDWDEDRERQLARALVLGSRALLPRFPLLVGLEWEAPDGSRGDLLFRDADGNYAVVEVKVPSRNKTKARGVVEKQALKFAGHLKSVLPAGSVTPLVYTDDEHDEGEPPRAPEARVRW